MPFIDLNEITEKEIVPGYFVRFVHTENMTFSFWNIKNGYSVHMHSHPQEQVCKVIEGILELTIEDETVVLEPGKVAVIPPNVGHSATALSDCRVIDTFYPVREDYKNLSVDKG